MTREEKISKIDDALMETIDARDLIQPLSYENEGIAEAQGLLLEARDDLQDWYDTLKYKEGHVYGHEKEYILRRLQKAKSCLNEQIDKYSGGNLSRVEDAAGELESAIKALS